MSFYIFHRHRVCLADCVDLIYTSDNWWEVWVFFLSHTAPGFQLWFYFHLFMWVVHWGLLLRLLWRILVCPCESQVWRWCSCLGHRGSGSTRYSGELAVRTAGNIVLYKGMATSIDQYAPVFLPGELPSLTEKPGRPQSSGYKELVMTEAILCAKIDARYFRLWQLCPSES